MTDWTEEDVADFRRYHGEDPRKEVFEFVMLSEWEQDSWDGEHQSLSEFLTEIAALNAPANAKIYLYGSTGDEGRSTSLVIGYDKPMSLERKQEIIAKRRAEREAQDSHERYRRLKEYGRLKKEFG